MQYRQFSQKRYSALGYLSPNELVIMHLTKEKLYLTSS